VEPWPNALIREPWRRPEPALSPRDAAKLLRVSPETVRSLLRSGRLAGVEVTPRRWKTTATACLRFLEGETR
jgi:excisionase family DNA binding protein